MAAASTAYSQQTSHALGAPGVKYVSGGIGAGSRKVMEHVRKDYNLRLTLARSGSGGYLLDVHVPDDLASALPASKAATGRVI